MGVSDEDNQLEPEKEESGNEVRATQKRKIALAVLLALFLVIAVFEAVNFPKAFLLLVALGFDGGALAMAITELTIAVSVASEVVAFYERELRALLGYPIMFRELKTFDGSRSSIGGITQRVAHPLLWRLMQILAYAGAILLYIYLSVAATMRVLTASGAGTTRITEVVVASLTAILSAVGLMLLVYYYLRTRFPLRKMLADELDALSVQWESAIEEARKEKEHWRMAEMIVRAIEIERARIEESGRRGLTIFGILVTGSLLATAAAVLK